LVELLVELKIQTTNKNSKFQEKCRTFGRTQTSHKGFILQKQSQA
jgi:hypothetical protein